MPLEHAQQRRLRLQAQILAALAVGCSALTIAMALAWRHEHQRAECWRAVAEGDTPPEGQCR